MLEIGNLAGLQLQLQLVSDDVTLLLTRKGISDIEECTPDRVKELWGVTPAQITDLKGLMGDSSDNIPGVPGVGEKTAVKLLAQYETLENVLAHGEEIKGKLGEKVRDNAESARFSKWLANELLGILFGCPIWITGDQEQHCLFVNRGIGCV